MLLMGSLLSPSLASLGIIDSSKKKEEVVYSRSQCGERGGGESIHEGQLIQAVERKAQIRKFAEEESQVYRENRAPIANSRLEV